MHMGEYTYAESVLLQGPMEGPSHVMRKPKYAAEMRQEHRPMRTTAGCMLCEKGFAGGFSKDVARRFCGRLCEQII